MASLRTMRRKTLWMVMLEGHLMFDQGEGKRGFERGDGENKPAGMTA